MLPVSPSCERNKDPILNVLSSEIGESSTTIFEMGSGTGQHGEYFVDSLPNLTWLYSDLQENMGILKERARLYNSDRLLGPFHYEMGLQEKFPDISIDAILTANTLHIMSWDFGQKWIGSLKNAPQKCKKIFIYGPFNYRGSFTSESNAQFEQWLKNRDPRSGIRNFEDINTLMDKSGFSLLKDYEMPSNNRLLVFHR